MELQCSARVRFRKHWEGFFLIIQLSAHKQHCTTTTTNTKLSVFSLASPLPPKKPCCLLFCFFHSVSQLKLHTVILVPRVCLKGDNLSYSTVTVVTPSALPKSTVMPSPAPTLETFKVIYCTIFSKLHHNLTHKASSQVCQI